MRKLNFRKNMAFGRVITGSKWYSQVQEGQSTVLDIDSAPSPDSRPFM